jgi:glutathione peroxidase
MTEKLEDITFMTADGDVGSLTDHRGDVVIVVNVASKCGLTPQYEALQSLYATKKDEGLTVLAFPANDFMGQEPGTDEEIVSFCSTQYDVTFPIMSKISVVGEDQHPLYAELTRAIETTDDSAAFRESLEANGISATQDPDVLWNFEKFVIGRSGEVVGRFAPSITPDDPRMLALLEAELRR